MEAPWKDTKEIDSLWPYLKSIDWTERWLMGLVVGHVACFTLTVATRKQPNAQAAIFLILLLLVYTSEYLNAWAADNWRLFSNEQYFDSFGLFISVVYSAPFLINCLIIIMNWLLYSSELLQKTKIAQLKRKAASIKAKGNSVPQGSESNQSGRGDEGPEDAADDSKKDN